MQRTKSTNGDSMLRLDVGEKYPTDAKDFRIIIGKEKNGDWYRFKPSASKGPVDPKTGYELRRRTVVSKTGSKAIDRHEAERAKFTETQERARRIARVAARTPTRKTIKR